MSGIDKASFAVSSFSGLEVELIACREYLPFVEANKQAISPKFVPIIMEACSLIDSIFRENTADKTKHYNLKKYGLEHEPRLSLHEDLSLFLNSPVQILRPFKDWTKKQPDWWAAYNKLKHDRLNNYEAATYTNAVLSVAGAHQLMARNKIFVGEFIKAGWINVQDDELMMKVASSAQLGALMGNPPDMVIESRLFASPTLDNFVLPESEDDPLYIQVDYDYPGLSNRVRGFIFAHEEW
jgi:hypothetical protein